MALSLNHFSIRTTDMVASRNFYETVLGLTVGPRPDFPFPGLWMYNGDHAHVANAMVHIIGLDKFVTFDEPWWVISGSNYYYALTHGDFENTIYDYHPAVTTTWVVTAGMLSYFPEYRGIGHDEYFDVRKPKFEEFMRSQGKEALDLIRNSRLIQSVLLIGLAV